MWARVLRRCLSHGWHPRHPCTLRFVASHRETSSRSEWLRASFLVLSGTCCTALIYKYLTDVEEVDYGDVQYWKARYAEEWYQQPYDWLGTFASLKPWIAEAAKGSRVVHLGCGTSLLAEEMFDSGAFGEIWNVDVSDACLQAGQKTRLIGGFPLLKSSCYCPPLVLRGIYHY